MYMSHKRQVLLGVMHPKEYSTLLWIFAGLIFPTSSQFSSGPGFKLYNSLSTWNMGDGSLEATGIVSSCKSCWEKIGGLDKGNWRRTQWKCRKRENGRMRERERSGIGRQLEDKKGGFSREMSLVCCSLPNRSLALVKESINKATFNSEFCFEASLFPIKKILPIELEKSYSLSFLRHLSNGQFCWSQIILGEVMLFQEIGQELGL